MDLIEIVLITYNRADDLNRTLTAILKSSLRNVQVTLLDNCSTDSSYEVAAAFGAAYSGEFNYRKNPQNLGGDANIMRAYEIATAEYVWVLCDDDILDFSRFQDAMRLLEHVRPDVLVVGSPLKKPSREMFPGKTEVSIPALELADTPIAIILTFIPAAIIKTERLKECDFSSGYRLVCSHFSQFFWISEMLNGNWLVFILDELMVRRPHIDHGLPSRLEYLNGFLLGASTLNVLRAKESAIVHFFGGSFASWVIMLVKEVVADIAEGRNPARGICEHALLVDGWVKRLFSFSVLVLTLWPRGAAIKIINAYKSRKSHA